MTTGCRNMLQMFMGKFLPTSSTSHQPQSAGSDLLLDVFNVCEKCDAACSRDLGNGSVLTEPSSAQ